VFEVDTELRDLHPMLDVEAVIADIRDEALMQRTLRRARPHVVFHAAAHKHVPYMERFASEAIMNNVWGTLNVVRAAQDVGAARLVFVSTDKAVRPRSVMGASKRLAEHLLQSLQEASTATRLLAVRFGNVLASRGSVVPLFQAQLRRGVPLTVTDPGATRYFMTIREACLLVLQASALGEGGEVFTLRMGRRCGVVDLAADVGGAVRLRPGSDPHPLHRHASRREAARRAAGGHRCGTAVAARAHPRRTARGAASARCVGGGSRSRGAGACRRRRPPSADVLPPSCPTTYPRSDRRSRPDLDFFLEAHAEARLQCVTDGIDELETSAARAPPSLTMKLPCTVEMLAWPRRRPLRPARSISWPMRCGDSS